MDTPIRKTLIELIQNIPIVHKALPQLNGMFAFAALDHQEKKLYLARDPFGIKPIYMATHDQTFRFASEARALHAMGTPNRSINMPFKPFLLFAIPFPHKPYIKASHAPPGHLLCYNLQTHTYEISSYITPTEHRFAGNFSVAQRSPMNNVFARPFDVSSSPMYPLGFCSLEGLTRIIAAMAKEEGTSSKPLPSDLELHTMRARLTMQHTPHRYWDFLMPRSPWSQKTYGTHSLRSYPLSKSHWV